ncbi:MAG: YbaK/EbsC family protein [Spirulina sp. SIO3F2]|nr:YbaK/EbsC family protein [Spirulina sp. SIO3F2]
MMKTPVTEFLDSHNILYNLKLHSQPVFTCEDAARERNVRLSQILKCMVGQDAEVNLYVMLIPGDKTLKIKRARQLAGGIRIELVAPEQLAEQLGLTVGAISPIQLLGKAKQCFMDHSVFREEWVAMSAGVPEAGVEVQAESLAELLGVVRGDIISVR